MALVQDKSRTSSGRNIGKITIKHASHQLAQYWDKVVRVTFLIMFDPLCISISFILFYFGNVPEWKELKQENNGDKNL